MSRKIFALYDDGVHIACFNTLYEAEYYVEIGDCGLSRYTDIEEEDFEEKCDCKNRNL